MLLTEEVLQPVHNKIIKTDVHTVNPDNIQAQPPETHIVNKYDLTKPIWTN